jgi:hypothetical protein
MTSFSKDKLKIAGDIRFVVIEDQAILLDSKHGIYLGLDEIGTAIWHKIEDGATLDEICDRLFKEYEVSRDVLACDIQTFVGQLKEKGLIEIVKTG